MLNEKAPTDSFDTLLKDLDAILNPKEPETSDAITGKRKRVEESWKQRIVEIIQRDICDGKEGWSSNDEANDTVWISNVLEYLRTRLSWYVVYDS